MDEDLRRVSNKIICLHRTRYCESLSPMKLQKLCYYAQAFYMAHNNAGTLFEDNFEAWQYGPVVRTLYAEYRDFGWKSIDTDIDDNCLSINEEENDFLEKIVSSFGSLDGAKLSEMTHKETPWITARNGLPDNAASTDEISKESIYNYFKNHLEE